MEIDYNLIKLGQLFQVVSLRLRKIAQKLIMVYSSLENSLKNLLFDAIATTCLCGQRVINYHFSVVSTEK